MYKVVTDDMVPLSDEAQKQVLWEAQQDALALLEARLIAGIPGWLGSRLTSRNSQAPITGHHPKPSWRDWGIIENHQDTGWRPPDR